MDPQLTREENRTQLKSKFKAFVNTCLEISIHNDLNILVSRSCNFSIAKKIYAERKHISVRCFVNSSRRGCSLRQGWGYFSSGSGEFSGWWVFLTRESLIFLNRRNSPSPEIPAWKSPLRLRGSTPPFHQALYIK